jgi:hypothetical protein
VLANLIWLAFFLFLRPGKYVWTNSEPHPFLLHDVTFKIATTAYSAATIPLKLLDLANYVGLNFTEQKNGIKNETIGLTRSRDISICPVLIMIRRVRHLREHEMPAQTPLFIYFKQGVQHRVTDRMITTCALPVWPLASPTPSLSEPSATQEPKPSSKHKYLFQ